MFVTEKQARERWCPLVRVEGNNRFFNTMSDGFANAPSPYHCIARECMGWRELRGTHLKSGAMAGLEGQGYCGFAGRPEME